MKRELSALESSLLANINKKMGVDNPMVQLGENSEYGKIRGYIDTGNYALNWLISGILVNGGWPVGRISELDGKPSTGKCASVDSTKIKLLNQEEKLAKEYLVDFQEESIKNSLEMSYDCIAVEFDNHEFIIPETSKVKTKRGLIKAKELEASDTLILINDTKNFSR